MIQGEHMAPLHTAGAPLVTITSPAHWATQSTANFTLSYDVSDDVGVSYCEFQISTAAAIAYPTCAETVLSYVHLQDSNKFVAFDFADGVSVPAKDRALDAEDNEGAIIGATATTSPGHGVALHFDGSGDYVLPASPSGGLLHSSFTHRSFEAWFKSDSTSGRQTLFEQGGNFNGFWLGIESGMLKFTTRAAGVAATASTTFTDTTSWHHIAAVYDAGAMTLYVDGSSAATQTASFSSVAAQSGEPGICRTSGNDAGGSSAVSYCFGDMDEVAIYQDALSSTEVADHAANTYITGTQAITVNAYDADSNVASDTHVFVVQ